jgi:hypothetical protein
MNYGYSDFFCDIAKVGITVGSGLTALITAFMIGDQGIRHSSESLKGVCILSLASFMVSTVVVCKTGVSCGCPNKAASERQPLTS